ncbi:Hypothetical_protein [Hexamita inflata]|uniref:Hypothetical_protein n=1 Tax=Hexamita inflata TaxID=28002 RepID=A0AA86V0G7_9EUKA|nr:Hypothetical protein HINF_LOCUS59281 [Hexamita inflata]
MELSFENQYRNKILRQELLSDNIIIEFNKMQTELREKKTKFKMYIKLIDCYEYGQNEIKLIIKDKYGNNRLNGGDYYKLYVGQEYVLFNSLEAKEQFQLVFDYPVTFIWIADFEDAVVNTKRNQIPQYFSGITRLRRGYYYDQNMYPYDQKVNLKVHITTPTGVAFTQTPSIQNSDEIKHQITKFVEPNTIKLHETVTIERIFGDQGLIKYQNDKYGWINIRFVSKIGSYGECQCHLCTQQKFQGLPAMITTKQYLELPTYVDHLSKKDYELAQKKQQQTQRELIQYFMIKEIYRQYLNCTCKNCQNVRQNMKNQQLTFVDIRNQTVQFYQKSKQCIKYQDVLNAIQREINCTYDKVRINQIYISFINNMKLQVTEKMLEELKILLIQCVKSQAKTVHEIVKMEMNKYMPRYNIDQVLNIIKCHFQHLTTSDQIILQESNLRNQLHLLIQQFANNMDKHNSDYVNYREQYYQVVKSGFTYDMLNEVLDIQDE